MRFLPIPLLAIGTVLGYGFAFHAMHHHRDHRESWERHVSDVCGFAAERVRGDNVRSDRPRNDKNDEAPPKNESNEP